jgi:hypothetical protein
LLTTSLFCTIFITPAEKYTLQIFSISLFSILLLPNPCHCQAHFGRAWQYYTTFKISYSARTTFKTSATVHIFVLNSKYLVVDAQCFPSYPCSHNQQVTWPLLHLFCQHSPLDQYADQQHAIHSDLQNSLRVPALL